MAKKLLQEVMEEIRLTEKKLSKDAQIFGKYSVITEYEKPDIGYRDGDRKNKFDRDLAAKEMQSKFQSYEDTVTRLASLKEIRDRANLETTIATGMDGKTKMSIYQALLMKRSLSKYLTDMFSKVENCKGRAENSNRNYVNTSLSGGRKGSVSSEVETYPLLNLKEVEKKAKDFEEDLSKIDAQISIANATTKVDVPD